MPVMQRINGISKHPYRGTIVITFETFETDDQKHYLDMNNLSQTVIKR